MRNNFSRKTRILPAGNFGKISSQKSAKTLLLYSHENRDQKWGEKTREIIFPVTHE